MSDKFIFCNDEICEADKCADALEEALAEIARLNELDNLRTTAECKEK